MSKQSLYEIKVKFILSLSMILLVVSIGLTANDILSFDYSFQTASFNIKEMATANVAVKTGNLKNTKKLIEVKSLEKIKNVTSNEVKPVNNVVPTRVWYLPTEFGRITTYPNYGHVAYDITSPRGSAEVIYPVASGVISSIYYDYAGAKIVTVRHLIDGRYYSSQYVHLSSFANIYVGQEVTPFTPLGWMGSTGMSTGVHLHITLADCNMFGNTDSCSDLNGFFRYIRTRYGQGFTGLGNVINVPYEWYGR